ncbi:hypothetical protein ACFVHQ_19180 [Actinomycetes bacterium NPDC127524]|uniref:hypothetical protein n=1 Tax=Bacillus sp. OV322 TaxID=1882764 RepID=UPI0015A58495|nr:hypothetical protein [Bacillus sp. OV322]
MEKAMQQSHGIGYSEYSRRLDTRIQVEKRREKDYEQGNLLANHLNRRIHS